MVIEQGLPEMMFLLPLAHSILLWVALSYGSPPAPWSILYSLSSPFPSGKPLHSF